MPKGVWREMFKAPASHTNENPLPSHSNTYSHQHILIQRTSIWRQTPPLSPMPQCLPITKEVINSTTAPSREIDFNDTSYMAAVSVPDSHLHTSRDPASRLSAALHCKAKTKLASQQAAIHSQQHTQPVAGSTNEKL